MNHSIVLAGVSAVLGLAAALPAHGQTSQFTTTIGATTDYRSKGTSKSLDDGSFSFGSDWISGNGQVYAGVAAATVDMAIGADYETDAKLGVRPKALGWNFDFAVFYRAFPDAVAGSDDDYVEARAQATRAWGPVSLRLLTWQTPDNVGPAGAANWSEARVLWRASPHVRGSVALGHHDQEAAPTYSAWNAGLGVDLRQGVELDLRWYDTDAHDAGERFKGEAVAALNFKY